MLLYKCVTPNFLNQNKFIYSYCHKRNHKQLSLKSYGQPVRGLEIVDQPALRGVDPISWDSERGQLLKHIQEDIKLIELLLCTKVENIQSDTTEIL